MNGLDKPMPEIAQICIHLFDQEISVVEGNFVLQELFSQAVQSYKDQLVEKIEEMKKTDTTQKLTLKWLLGYNGTLDQVISIIKEEKK
jgi:hypothetical protein